MKDLKQHWSAQPLSVLLSFLMALPVLALFLIAPPAAQAQVDPQPRWAVLDFANPSGYGTSDVGRLAGDAFVVELAKLNRYTIIPRQEVLNGIQAENLTPPLNATSINRLGEAIGVNAMVAGEIASVSFSRDRRQAKVSVVVRVIDPRTGALLNGALAEGFSNPRPIPVTDEEQLVNEAFSNAAFNAVKQISKFNIPVATVLISGASGLNGKSTTVTLNKGSRDGLTPGMEMLVTRNGAFAGRIRISDTTNNDANAVIVDAGTGIQPEDRATALYKLPSYSIDRTTGTFNTTASTDVGTDQTAPRKHRNAFNGVGGVLIAIAAAFLLYAAIRTGHKDSSLGGAGISGVHATAGRASELGGTLNFTIPVGVSIPNYIPVAVRITADTGNIGGNQFLEFHVYRSDSPAILSSPAALGVLATSTVSGGGGNNNNNNNGGNNNGGTVGLGVASFGQVPLLAQTGRNSLLVFDDPNPKTSVIASKPDVTDSASLITVTVTPTVTAGVSSILPGTGLQLGQRVFYIIEGLYIQPSTFSTGTINPGTSTGSSNNNNNNNGGGGNNNNNGGGGNNNNNNGGGNNNNNGGGGNNNGTTGHGQTFQLTGKRQTNSITLIEPVHPFANSVSGTGLNNVNITVPSTLGGNDYILQISTDPGFSTVQTYRSASGSFFATPADPTNQASGTALGISTANGTAVVFNNINLTTAFPNGGTFFYRVGARDSANGNGGDNAYIFSDPLALNLNGDTTTGTLPPAAPTAQIRARLRGR